MDWALKPPGRLLLTTSLYVKIVKFRQLLVFPLLATGPAAHVVEVKVAWHTTMPVDPEAGLS